MFIPTGGLMRPISTTHTMMMPNQIGSKPEVHDHREEHRHREEDHRQLLHGGAEHHVDRAIAATTMVGFTSKRVTKAFRSAGIVVMLTNSANISAPIRIMNSMAVVRALSSSAA